jgi:seryl-tRNA synthetase
MTNTKQIENRIRELTLERTALESAHNALVQQNQKINQEFQQQVVQNQTRFAQITGAITELKKLTENLNQGNTHHDHSIPTPDLGDRAIDVCLSEQPKGR